MYICRRDALLISSFLTGFMLNASSALNIALNIRSREGLRCARVDPLFSIKYTGEVPTLDKKEGQSKIN